MARITRSMSNAFNYKTDNKDSIFNKYLARTKNVVEPYIENGPNCCSEVIKKQLDQVNPQESKKDLYEDNINKNKIVLSSSVLPTDKPICDICKKKFKFKAHIIKHLRTHTREKPFQCRICDLKFFQKCYYEKHLTNHNGDKPSDSRNRNKITVYINLTCKICNKHFMQESHLRSHLRTHNVKKPFICDICQMIFTQRSHLISHLQVHNKEQFICDVCKKMFKHKGRLISHILSHNRSHNRCEICNRNFDLKSTLIRHLRVHSGEKPFSCSSCKLKFRFKFHLTRHLNNHLKQTSSLSLNQYKQKRIVIQQIMLAPEMPANRHVSEQHMSGPWRFVELDANEEH